MPGDQTIRGNLHRVNAVVEATCIQQVVHHHVDGHAVSVQKQVYAAQSVTKAVPVLIRQRTRTRSTQHYVVQCYTSHQQGRVPTVSDPNQPSRAPGTHCRPTHWSVCAAAHSTYSRAKISCRVAGNYQRLQQPSRVINLPV